MLGYVLRRLVATIPVIIVVAVVVFSLTRLTPGDPAAVIAGENATTEQIALIRNRLGLDQPLLVQFGRWSWNIAHGDLGVSIFTNTPVAGLIAQRIGPTLSLAIVTVIFGLSLGIPAGVLAAVFARRLPDRVVMVLAVAGFSIPIFVLAYLLILGFAISWPILPVQGYTPMAQGFLSWLGKLILPSLALALVYAALIARTTRAALLDVLAEDYIRTAKAKGLLPREIVWLHALKAASVPIATVVGIGIALLVGGAVVIETVFAIPGLGRLTVDAIARRDFPVIQGVILLFSGVYVLINLVIDLSYTWLDPRVRFA
ncbi:ABC transporter permease [Reyranella sp. CPCC 100927]|uniref:ABC transporter permease n=1 Tax=Reyranella sp. CPCC 100927 TaxID=2599616 RepID=UPI0011B66423|nr:ABC transporter permease [Reyranella sp. CPCC 100927]TWS99866.1 ABC transporter permease [Reyranella sp. CPCC 100927]